MDSYDCPVIESQNQTVLRSPAVWADHFRENVRRDWGIPWQTEVRLSEVDRNRIASSIAEFQRGESSEALRYLAKSREFSGAIGDASFHDASILFVREEN